jgi:predicted peroxiredoxin
VGTATAVDKTFCSAAAVKAAAKQQCTKMYIVSDGAAAFAPKLVEKITDPKASKKIKVMHKQDMCQQNITSGVPVWVANETRIYPCDGGSTLNTAVTVSCP